MTVVHQIFLILFCSLISYPTDISANVGGLKNDINLCEKAILEVSRDTGVSEKLLLSVAKIETGRTVNGEIRPWPWTVHFNGRGYWFDNRETALYFVYEKVRNGATNIDLGCFQINYRWHGNNFESVFDIFDPFYNASYAATFLSDLYHETKDWKTAIGAFHSKTPSFAQAYINRYEAMAQKDVKRGPVASPLLSRVPQVTAIVHEPAADRQKAIASLVTLETMAKAAPMFMMPYVRD